MQTSTPQRTSYLGVSHIKIYLRKHQIQMNKKITEKITTIMAVLIVIETYRVNISIDRFRKLTFSS